MKQWVFKNLFKFNKAILPSFTKKRLDLARATKFQLAILGWKTWVTKNAVDQ